MPASLYKNLQNTEVIADQIRKIIIDLLKDLKKEGGFNKVSGVSNIAEVKGSENLLNCTSFMSEFYESLNSLFNSNRLVISNEMLNCDKIINSFITETKNSVAALKQVNPEEGLDGKSFKRYKDVNSKLLNINKNFLEKIPKGNKILINQCNALQAVLSCLR